MNKVTLSRPAVGETLQVAMRNGQVYLLEFDLGETTVAENGGDVMLTFDDGSGLVLRNFFSAAKVGDFYLTLPDGAVLSGQDIAESLALSLENFHPSENYAFLDADHGMASPLHGLEEDPLSGLPRGTPCELPAGHGGDGSSSLSFFPHGGNNVPHFNEVLDTSLSPCPAASGDLESLLPPSAAPHQPSLLGAGQEAGGGETPTGNAVAGPPVFSAFPADPGGETQDQHLLAHFFLLPL